MVFRFMLTNYKIYNFAFPCEIVAKRTLKNKIGVPIIPNFKI